ncbi:hypothetical protein GCM10018785_52030 [Streptomyces longispororuber]|uniref:Uncharacterized protein n=1 Tax=Streptomyces longispororuber TaxID=68230 RepID=A0A918ZZS4_9ACTN|nr:hypothetical protein GCM10018785_52030 [Streptomyces longispororuber]
MGERTRPVVAVSSPSLVSSPTPAAAAEVAEVVTAEVAVTGTVTAEVAVAAVTGAVTSAGMPAPSVLFAFALSTFAF